MAVVTIGMPIFSGGPDEDVERHVELFTGYIAGLGIDPTDIAGGPPTGTDRTLGLFRASLTGEAGQWYDETFIGKHWELNNVYDNTTANTWANLRARTMAQLLASNSIRNPSALYTYATTAGNNANTLAHANVLPPGRGLVQDWSILGGRPTDRAPQLTGVNPNPVVIADIRLGNTIYWFKTNYKTIQKAKREAKFGDLVQGDMPIDVYYKQVSDTGKLLEYPDQYIETQFFRGLNDENLLEADRQGDKPLRELVDSLKKIEKRKTEMKIGMQRRNMRSDLQQYNIAPVQAPPVVSAQEPNILKPVTSHAITQDMLDKLLKTHTENLTKNFQTQLQTLQNTVAQTQKKVPPPIPPKDHRKIHDWYESRNPFDDEYDREYTFDDIMGNNREAMEYAKIFAKASAKAKKDKMDRKIDKLANMMGNLNIEDTGPVPMDVNISDGVILQDADGNEFTVCLTRGSKKK